MNSNIKSLLIVFILFQGCAQNPNRAGCTYFDGEGRYGMFTQFTKGNTKGTHIYIGEDVKEVKIICNSEKQEVNVSID